MARTQGMVTDLGDGRFRIRWSDGTRNGRRISHCETLTNSTLQKAQRRLGNVLDAKDDHTYTAPSNLTVDAWLDHYLVALKANRSSRGLTDVKLIYSRHVRPVIGRIKLQKLRKTDVRELVDGLSDRAGRPLSHRTHQVVLQNLKQALDLAVEDNLLKENPCKGIRAPRILKQQKQDKRSLTATECASFLAATKNDRFAALWQVMATTGCRPGEVLGLKWSDLDTEKGTIRFERAVTQDGKYKLVLGDIKNKKPRAVPLPPTVLESLQAHKARQSALLLKQGRGQGDGLIFTTLKGGLVRIGNLRDLHFFPALERAKIQKQKGDGPYLLRHTCATLLLAGGESVASVAARLGDTNETILKHYAHELPGEQQAATDKIGSLLFGS